MGRHMRSLGMTFEVQYAQREPLKTLDIARALVGRAAEQRPQYIVITDDYSVADQLVGELDALDIGDPGVRDLYRHHHLVHLGRATRLESTVRSLENIKGERF